MLPGWSSKSSDNAFVVCLPRHEGKQIHIQIRMLQRHVHVRYYTY